MVIDSHSYNAGRFSEYFTVVNCGPYPTYVAWCASVPANNTINLYCNDNCGIVVSALL